MSIDLNWGALDEVLADSLLQLLNKQLSNATLPSFMGPVEVSSLQFGTASPEVDIVDIRDIYRDFLECSDDDDDNADNGEPKVTPEHEADSDGFEWVSRRSAGRGIASDREGLAYHHLPPHVRYGRGPSADVFGGIITPGMTQTNRLGSYSGGMMNLRDMGPLFHPASPLNSPFLPGSAAYTPQSRQSPIPTHVPLPMTPDAASGDVSDAPAGAGDDVPQASPDNEADNLQPDVQLHFHVNHHSDIRFTVTTSMLINYPSPMFMALPIKLSVTGLIFNGEVVLAYQGSKKRVHISVLDDQDPYGPIGDRVSKNSNDTPPDPDSPLPRSPKPLPVTSRLLPSIFIESEIGQADKHVLKNVTRVERFIQDAIRRTLEDELVFPNFHTVLLPS